MTHYLAIFEQAGQRIVIEYIPLEGGGIEIVSVDIQQRPHTWQELKAAHQRTPLERKPRQLGMFRDTLREP